MFFAQLSQSVCIIPSITHISRTIITIRVDFFSNTKGSPQPAAWSQSRPFHTYRPTEPSKFTIRRHAPGQNHNVRKQGWTRAQVGRGLSAVLGLKPVGLLDVAGLSRCTAPHTPLIPSSRSTGRPAGLAPRLPGPPAHHYPGASVW